MPAADPFEELAALFLTQSEGDAPRSAGVLAPIEIVAAGNLPLMGTLWLSQYAEWCARAQGPVALIRLDAEPPTIEVFHPEERPEGRPSNLTAWLQQERIARWIVKPGPNDTWAQTLREAVDRVAILTGADEAAVVAAYRLVKDIAEASPADAEPPALSVVVVGAETERVREVVEKLNRTATSFLGVHLPLAAAIQRIDAVDAVGPWIFESATSMHDCVREAQSIRSKTPRSVGGRASPRKAPAANEAEPSPSRRVALAPKPAEPRPEMRAEARPRIEAAPKRTLCSHLSALEALPVRCPGVDEVEIAVDGRGRLHVLAREQDAVAALKVQAWIGSHRAILTRAFPAFKSADDAVIHLFGETPARLIPLMGTPWKVHLLAPVDVDGARGWYFASLNDSAV
jgi:hypothetical protein